jgi:DNA-binding XRE family transcriptional regulator
MDQWDFKKWRKKLGINQVSAGEMLGLSRDAVQHCENEIRPVPHTIELACQELLRLWLVIYRKDFGAVQNASEDFGLAAKSRRAGDAIVPCTLAGAAFGAPSIRRLHVRVSL